MNVRVRVFLSIRTIRRSSKKAQTGHPAKRRRRRPAVAGSTKWRWTGSAALPLHPNTVPCRWSGTYRRYRPSVAADAGGLPHSRQLYSASGGDAAYSGPVLANILSAGDTGGHSGAKADDGDAPLHALTERLKA